MTPPENLGLDPRTVISRWCELECSAFTDLTCQGNPEPSPEEISLHSHRSFQSGSARNPACVAACAEALPGLLSRPYPISRYFVENDGVEIARRLQRQDPEGQRCGPPPLLIPVTSELPHTSTLPNLELSRSYFTQPAPSLWPIAAAIALGVVMVFAPEVGLVALL